ncbi:hypothetical protein BXY66_0058 [Shimia isoporae]|uniref:TPR repeat protein n=1 Tax=Shimia isoporae TaxID=647720 RepID=A0A4R1NII0_9RHOB|nr:sel1 repeat family protein [Shimia isoporae]TCL08027.1 hypothetical protein BXY66_0058 [Shimia isoporae]
MFRLLSVSAKCMALVMWLEPAAAATESVEELTPKQRYTTAENLRKSADPDAAFLTMSALAQEGYSPAQEKLGYYLSRGVGTAVDMEAAARWYEAAIAAGRDRARVGYAKLLVSEGRTGDAVAQLEAAMARDVDAAAPTWAEYHYFQKFGEASDVEAGRAGLLEAAQAGHVRSMGIVFQGLKSGDVFEADANVIEANLLAVARDPENRDGGRAAEALVKGLRGNADMMPEREELLSHPLLRGKVRGEETLWLASEKHKGRAFWTAADEIVANASDEDFARVLYLVSRVDKNAYVYVLQRELTERGYATGRRSGLLTARTLNSITRFCAAQEITRTCRFGPMRSYVIKEITKELARVGSGEQRADRP